MSPTAKDVWALLCQASGAAHLDDKEFFGELMMQRFYPTHEFRELNYNAKMTFVPLMQAFLNELREVDTPEIQSPLDIQALNVAVAHYNRGPWYVSTRGGAATTIPSYRQFAKTVLNDGIDDSWLLHADGGTHVMRQTAKDVALQRASISSLQCKRLQTNHVHLLTRSIGTVAPPRHVLFVEEHPSNHECVVNNPNYSSLQLIEDGLKKKCKSGLDSFFKTTVYDTCIGLCHTWSLFELECNITGCAGIHQQLRKRYQGVLDEFNYTDYVAPKNASGAALEAALEKAYPLYPHKTRQAAPTLLVNHLCRRFAHIFNYAAYPTHASDWPELVTDGRRAVPIEASTNLNFYVDKSNASFSEAYKAYCADHTSTLRGPHHVTDTCC
jgi:hypothetical protein